MEDYAFIMQNCRRKNPLKVHFMGKTDFYGTGDIEKSIVNRKTDINKEKVNWLKTREIVLTKGDKFSIEMRAGCGDSDKTQTVDIRKKCGRPTQQPFFFTLKLVSLWPQGKPISSAKLADIKSVMHLIPSDAKLFYKGLVPDGSVVDDLEGFNAPLDFVLEEEDDSA